MAARRQLLRGGLPVEVEERVLDLLLLLLRNRDRALDRREVIAAIWGSRPIGEATLRQLVYKARHVVGDDGGHQHTIRTVYGRSLRWVARVEQAPDDDVPGLPPTDPPATSESVADGDAVAVPTPPAAVVAARSSPPRLRVPRVAGAVLVVLVLLVCGLVVLRPWRQLAAGSGAVEPPQPAPVGVTTLAVLPFTSVAAQPRQRYFSDGLTEELINRLARMPHLRVTARTSSFEFRDRGVDVREVARRLGVAKVVEGSVQQAGSRWRVRVALVDARSGFQLWTSEYDVEAGDLLALEDRIARSVTMTLYPELATASPRSASASGVVPAAQDSYFVGLEYLDRRTLTDLGAAIAHFQRAVSAQPDYAQAWAALATAWAVWNDYDGDHPPDLHYQDALTAARRAVALDPRLARAHAVLGLLAMTHWQWSQARAELELALQLDPSDATAHQWYAMYLWYMHDMDAALAQMRMAAKLDPLSPVINIDLGRALLYAGHQAAAMTQYREAVALAPRFALAHIFLAEGDMAQDHYPEALQEVRTAIALAPQPVPPSYVAMLGVALQLAGDDAGARAQLAALEARSRKHYVSGVALAFLAAQLGERDQAFAALSAAVAAHDPMLQPAISDHEAVWYADPRIKQLRARMNLPPH